MPAGSAGDPLRSNDEIAQNDGVDLPGVVGFRQFGYGAEVVTTRG